MTEEQLGIAMLSRARAEGHRKVLPRSDKGRNISDRSKQLRDHALRHIASQPGVTHTRLAQVVRANRNIVIDILARCVADGELRYTVTNTGTRHYYPVKEVA